MTDNLKKSFRLVLASRSPRRRQLLEKEGFRFEIIPADDELEEKLAQSLSRQNPKEFVRLLAKFKAENVAQQILSKNKTLSDNASQTPQSPQTSKLFSRQTIVLACDSVAVCHDEILGKPQDEFDARRMLQQLNGSTHFVYTGLCLWDVDSQYNISVVESSQLRMALLNSKELNDYLASGLWKGKAGAFGYQDGNDWLFLEAGSASNVVGLPIERFKEELNRFLNQ